MYFSAREMAAGAEQYLTVCRGRGRSQPVSAAEARHSILLKGKWGFDNTILPTYLVSLPKEPMTLKIYA